MTVTVPPVTVTITGWLELLYCATPVAGTAGVTTGTAGGSTSPAPAVTPGPPSVTAFAPWFWTKQPPGPGLHTGVADALSTDTTPFRYAIAAYWAGAAWPAARLSSSAVFFASASALAASSTAACSPASSSTDLRTAARSATSAPSRRYVAYLSAAGD